MDRADDQRNGKVDDERHVATLLPNQEVTLEGSNTDPNRDVFANCYHAHGEGPDGQEEVHLGQGQTRRHNLGEQRVHAQTVAWGETETDSDSWYLGVHGPKTLNWAPDFKAWVHRDADEGDSKVMKMTLNQVPA